jgi:hypothetical protein
MFVCVVAMTPRNRETDYQQPAEEREMKQPPLQDLLYPMTSGKKNTHTLHKTAAVWDVGVPVHRGARWPKNW